MIENKKKLTKGKITHLVKMRLVLHPKLALLESIIAKCKKCNDKNCHICHDIKKKAGIISRIENSN